MATVKLILGPGETEDQAKNLLLKALMMQSSGGTHSETFAQPSAEAVAAKMMSEHAEMWKTMIFEIEAVLKSETHQ